MNNPHDQTAATRRRKTARIKLLAVLAIFVVPLVIATVLQQKYRDGASFQTVSNGELIWPAVPLEAFSLPGVSEHEQIDLDWLRQGWALIYPLRGDCRQTCQQNLYHMRQIHVALGKNAHRVQRLVIVPAPLGELAPILADYPALPVAMGERAALAALYEQFERAQAELPERPDSFYLTDPLGNLMLRFGPELDPKGVLKDIKRLLRASRIG